MSMNDLLSDTITRLRNGQQARLATVRCKASNLIHDVLQVLNDEGFIRGFQMVELSPGRQEMEVELKYYEDKPVIHEIKRVSTPGRRVYAGIADLPTYKNGLGVTILSTSKGVMSDRAAREANVGGEVICKVF